MTLDSWLAKIYKADTQGGDKATLLAEFKTALSIDPDLNADALVRQTELNELIGERGQQACAYSTKYWTYLNAVLML